MEKIKYLTILFVILVVPSLSQAQIFDFWNNKAYKIGLKGADDVIKADFIERQMEKSQFAIFSYVDPKTSAGYFVVENNSKAMEIQNSLNNEHGYPVIEFQEIPLTEELFIEMYMKRGGVEKADFSNTEPKQIKMGPFVELSFNLYQKASDVWKKLYSTAHYNKIHGMPEHYPIFVNTGNPENDGRTYEQAKQEWLKNYPEESQYSTGVPYQDDNAKKAKSSENK